MCLCDVYVCSKKLNANCVCIFLNESCLLFVFFSFFSFFIVKLKRRKNFRTVINKVTKRWTCKKPFSAQTLKTLLQTKRLNIHFSPRWSADTSATHPIPESIQTILSSLVSDPKGIQLKLLHQIASANQWQAVSHDPVERGAEIKGLLISKIICQCFLLLISGGELQQKFKKKNLSLNH